MKKVLLAAVVFVLGTSALSAQTATPWFIAGSATAAFEKFGDDKAGVFEINPQVGYMFNDNWGVALDLGFGYAKNNDNKLTTIGVGLSGLYSMKITDKFFYTPSLRVGFENETPKMGDVKGLKTTNIGAELDFLKFEFRPSCHWGITAGFGTLAFVSSKVEDADDSTISGGLDLSNTEVGFKYYF